jgi:hypothetical protein
MWKKIKEGFDTNADPKRVWRAGRKKASVTQILSWPEGVTPVAEYLLRTTIGGRLRPEPPAPRQDQTQDHPERDQLGGMAESDEDYGERS